MRRLLRPQMLLKKLLPLLVNDRRLNLDLLCVKKSGSLLVFLTSYNV